MKSINNRKDYYKKWAQSKSGKAYLLKRSNKLKNDPEYIKLKNKRNRDWYYSEAGRNYFTKKSNNIDYICRMACSRLKIRAKKKNLPFNLTTKYLISIFS